MGTLTTASGLEAASYEHDEFGRRIATSETSVSSSKTFVGGLGVIDENGDTGLQLMSQRWMDPSLGRFLSRDPIGDDSLNSYSYGDQNPMTYTDSTGLDTYLDLVVATGKGYNPNGHAFIEVRPIEGTGSPWTGATSYGTYPQVGLITGSDMLNSLKKGVRRTRRRIKLGPEQEAALMKFIKEYEQLSKVRQWYPGNTCANFALKAWNTAAPQDKQISPKMAREVVDPDTLSNPILQAILKNPWTVGAPIVKTQVTPHKLGRTLIKLNHENGSPTHPDFAGGPKTPDFYTPPLAR